MSEILKIEAAYNVFDKFLGYRLTVIGEKPCLVFADQDAMPGIRSTGGMEGFTPCIDEKITYQSCKIVNRGMPEKKSR